MQNPCHETHKAQASGGVNRSHGMAELGADAHEQEQENSERENEPDAG